MPRKRRKPLHNSVLNLTTPTIRLLAHRRQYKNKRHNLVLGISSKSKRRGQAAQLRRARQVKRLCLVSRSRRRRGGRLLSRAGFTGRVVQIRAVVSRVVHGRATSRLPARRTRLE